MKKSDESKKSLKKGAGNQTQNTDNGWRPRFQLKDDTKSGVLDLQMEIMSKFYPTKESREQERLAAQSRGEAEESFASESTQNATETEELQENTYSDLGDATTEVYTRLKAPKEKDDPYQTEKRTYRRMPGTEDRDDEPAAQPKRRGLRSAVTVEDDGEGNIGEAKLLSETEDVFEKQESKRTEYVTEKAVSEPVAAEPPVRKETSPQDLFNFGGTPSGRRREPVRTATSEETKSHTNVTQELDRLFSGFQSAPQRSPLKEQPQAEQQPVEPQVPIAAAPVEEPMAAILEPVQEVSAEMLQEVVQEVPEELPVEEAVEIWEETPTEPVFSGWSAEREAAEEAEPAAAVSQTNILDDIEETASFAETVEDVTDTNAEESEAVEEAVPEESGSWSGGSQSLDDMLRERVSIPVVDVMAGTTLDIQVPDTSAETEPEIPAEASATAAEEVMPQPEAEEKPTRKKARQKATEPEEAPVKKAKKPEKVQKEDSPTKKTLKRLLRMIVPYSPIIMISLIASTISVCLQLYAPYLFGQIVDYAVGQDAVNTNAILDVMQKLLIVIAACAGVQWICEVCNNRVTFRVVQDLRCKAFNHIQSLPLRYVDGKKQGELVNCVMTDVDQISDGLLLGFSQLFSGLVMIIGTLIFMIVIDWRVTIGVVVLTPLSLVVASQIANRTYHMFRQQSEDRGQLASHVEEMIGNQKVVIAFGHESESIEAFDRLNDQLAQSSRKATFFSSITNPSTRFVNSLVYAFVGVIGAIFGIQGTFSIGDLSCFLSYAKQYTKPFNEISGVIAELQNALACAARVFELLDEPAEAPDEDGAVEILRVNGMMALEDVSFSYTPERPLIQNFNLQVTQGQRVAIVGPTGCGKTTLINLLMRFYDANSGEIFVSGRNVKKIKKNSLRNQYGMVLQETWIRSGTIHDNIAYGKPGATREEVEQAAKAVHAHSFIRRLPEGYDTVLTEDGGNLSQGQKQLLCIARVMLKKPPMLILDEATSSIDTRTEIRIQKAFAEMMQGRTSFIVAHRLSTIQEADIILVMRDGNVIEQGTHEELLAKGGFYHELYHSQYAAT